MLKLQLANGNTKFLLRELRKLEIKFGFPDILLKEMQKNMVWQLNGTLSLWAQQIGMVQGCT